MTDTAHDGAAHDGAAHDETGETPWQLLPEMAAEQYEALKASILAAGRVEVPVVYDQDTGAILDGHHRVRAVAELRAEGHEIAEPERQLRSFTDDDARARFALELNYARRHLTPPERAKVARQLRDRGWTLQQIGDTLGVTHPTVIADLRKGRGEAPRFKLRQVPALAAVVLDCGHPALAEVETLAVPCRQCGEAHKVALVVGGLSHDEAKDKDRVAPVLREALDRALRRAHSEAS